VETLRAQVSDQHQLTGLHARRLVARDHVRLNDQGHSRLEREVRDRRELAACAPEHRRQISADEPVDEVVTGRVASLLDHRRGRHQLGRCRARVQAIDDRIEGGDGYLVQLDIQRGRLGGDGERAQDLARVAPKRGADLAAHRVTGLDPAGGRPLRGHAHRGGADVMDVSASAGWDVRALADVGDLVLAEAGAELGGERVDSPIGELAADPQPADLLRRLDPTQAQIVGAHLDHRAGDVAQRQVGSMGQRSDHRHRPAGGTAAAQLRDRRLVRVRPRPAHVCIGRDPGRVRDVVVEVDKEHVAFAGREHAQCLACHRPPGEPRDRRSRPIRPVEDRVLGSTRRHRAGERRPPALDLGLAEPRIRVRPGPRNGGRQGQHRR
jgi:hypothetical protein